MDILSPLYVIQNESMLTLVYQTKMKKRRILRCDLQRDMQQQNRHLYYEDDDFY